MIFYTNIASQNILLKDLILHLKKVKLFLDLILGTIWFKPQYKLLIFISKISFRYADKIYVNGTTMRTLYKVYGLRFVINIVGIAGKFNSVQLLLTIGACLGLLSISSLIADFLTLSCFAIKKSFINVNDSPTKLRIIDNDEVRKFFCFFKVS